MEFTLLVWMIGSLLIVALIAIGRKKPKLQYAMSYFTVAYVGLGCFIGLGYVLSSQVQAIRTDHAGHEALHKAIEAKLRRAETGDIIVFDPEVSRDILIVRGHAGSKPLLRVTPPLEYADLFRDYAGLASSHAILVKKNAPEYGRLLGRYFVDRLNQ